MEEKNIDYVFPVERDDLKPRRKKTRFLGIIGVAVLAVLLVFFLLSVLPVSFTGAWELTVNPEIAQATEDEVDASDKVYYVFEKPDRYGRGEYCTCYQGGVEYYRYELLEEDSVKKINLGSQNLSYKFTGSKLLGTAKLIITYPAYTDETTGEEYAALEYIFEQAKGPKYEKEAFKDYDIDSALLDEKWISNERTLPYYIYSLPYNETVEFNDGGIMTIRYESEALALDRYMYYAYTAKDSKLTFSLVTDKETTYTVSYEFDENGNLKFSDDITSASIFADAFFGEFTFYTEENLPEPTQAETEGIETQ